MSTADKLRARLARSLPKPKRAKGTPPAAAPPPAQGNAEKVSVSLHAAELARVDEICAYMIQHGHRVNTSEAIKLALRTAPLDVDMVKAYEQVKAQDGRRKGRES